MSGNRVAVIFDSGDNKTSEGSEEKPAEQPPTLPIHWVDGIIASQYSYRLICESRGSLTM